MIALLTSPQQAQAKPKEAKQTDEPSLSRRRFLTLR